jgi:hypothetical protein
MKLDLIDVQKSCLVQLNTSARYVSLSYVWGRVAVLKTTKENRQVLMQPRVFERIHPAPLVQDAIELVRLIGERYLWVDSLCIPQNDTEVTAFYVNRMDYIYSKSVITVIAASSNSAMDRLPGVRPGSRGPQHTPKIGNMRLVTRTRELEAPLEESNYESRAWTFQERLLSHRCLILTELEAFLCCPSVLLSELHGSLPEACKRFHSLRNLTRNLTREVYPKSTSMWLENISYLIPSSSVSRLQGILLYKRLEGTMETSDMQTWYENMLYLSTYHNLVMSFTKRQLTYEADILRAFAGICASLETQMQRGRILFGIPTTGFALGLCWISRGLTRRRYTCTSPEGAEDFALPSWSWAGWTGSKEWLFLELFRPTVDHFAIGAGVQWEGIHVGKPTRMIHSIPLILRFTTTWLQASSFRYRAVEKEALLIPNEDELEGMKYYLIDFPVQEIIGSIDGKDTQSGLVFGTETAQLNDPNVIFIALGLWFTPGLGSRYHAPRYYVTSGKFTVCIAARWTDQERTVCERIGLALVEARLWSSTVSEIAPGVIHLA